MRKWPDWLLATKCSLKVGKSLKYLTPPSRYQVPGLLIGERVLNIVCLLQISPLSTQTNTIIKCLYWIPKCFLGTKIGKNVCITKDILWWPAGVCYLQNNDYLRKFADVGTPAIETTNASPLALSGHMTVQITPGNFLITALNCAHHHFELACLLMTLFVTKALGQNLTRLT